jgi:hypothetical protein
MRVAQSGELILVRRCGLPRGRRRLAPIGLALFQKLKYAGVLVPETGAGMVWAADAVPSTATASPAAKSEAESKVKTEKKSKKERSKLDFVVTAMPASLLVDAQGDKFSVDGDRMSNVYMMPTIACGPGMAIGDFYVDLLGGVGLVVNDTFQSFMLEAVLSGTYAFSDSLNIGPRVGIVYFTDPNFTDDDRADFKDSLGWLLGVQFTMGDRIQYIVSVDLLTISMDADAAEGVVLSDNSLDLAGLTFQFGVRGEF